MSSLSVDRASDDEDDEDGSRRRACIGESNCCSSRMMCKLRELLGDAAARQREKNEYDRERD